MDKTGGPAFPALRESEDPSRPLFAASFGMTLLDWFAGQAITAEYMAFRRETETVPECSQLANNAYATAEAMLAEKRRREAENG